jgi:hypothetical protein
MNQVPLSSALFPLSYYFKGLRLIVIAALSAVLFYIAGSPAGRLRKKMKFVIVEMALSIGGKYHA